MEYQLQPSDQDINDQLDAAQESIMKGTSRWPGRTYEQGVDHALNWAVGNHEDAPMSD